MSLGSRDNDEMVAAGVAGVMLMVGAFATIFCLIVLRCWVIAKIWEWYLVPGLHVQMITLPVAFGISLLFAFLSPAPKNEKGTFKRGIAYILGTLLAAWVGSWWM